MLVAVSTSIKTFIPYYWGRYSVSNKLDKLTKEKQVYDCLFFGSSRTYRHIDVVLFDSITGYNSYNLGGEGVFFLETHYLLEHFLKEYEGPRLKIFLQKLTPHTIADINFHKQESNYWADFKRMKMAIIHFSKARKFEQVWRHFISWLENSLCIFELKGIRSYRTGNIRQITDEVLTQNRGYYPLDKCLEIEQSEVYKNRRKEFLSSERYQLNESVNKKSKQLNIVKLSPEQINLNTYGKSVELYQIQPIKLDVEYYFDRVHFNQKGAEIFTQKIAAFITEKGW